MKGALGALRGALAGLRGSAVPAEVSEADRAADCGNPDCFCCHPPSHYCDPPRLKGLGQEFACPECGKGWSVVETPDRINPRGTLPAMVWTNRRSA